jgi:hypothetical protein
MLMVSSRIRSVRFKPTTMLCAPPMPQIHNVLVERTTGEVLPVIQNNKEQVRSRFSTCVLHPRCSAGQEPMVGTAGGRHQAAH